MATDMHFYYDEPKPDSSMFEFTGKTLTSYRSWARYEKMLDDVAQRTAQFVALLREDWSNQLDHFGPSYADASWSAGMYCDFIEQYKNTARKMSDIIVGKLELITINHPEFTPVLQDQINIYINYVSQVIAKLNAQLNTLKMQLNSGASFRKRLHTKPKFFFFDTGTSDIPEEERPYKTFSCRAVFDAFNTFQNSLLPVICYVDTFHHLLWVPSSMIASYNSNDSNLPHQPQQNQNSQDQRSSSEEKQQKDTLDTSSTVLEVAEKTARFVATHRNHLQFGQKLDSFPGSDPYGEVYRYDPDHDINHFINFIKGYVSKIEGRFDQIIKKLTQLASAHPIFGDQIERFLGYTFRIYHFVHKDFQSYLNRVKNVRDRKALENKKESEINEDIDRISRFSSRDVLKMHSFFEDALLPVSSFLEAQHLLLLKSFSQVQTQVPKVPQISQVSGSTQGSNNTQSGETMRQERGTVTSSSSDLPAMQFQFSQQRKQQEQQQQQQHQHQKQENAQQQQAQQHQATPQQSQPHPQQQQRTAEQGQTLQQQQQQTQNNINNDGVVGQPKTDDAQRIYKAHITVTR